MTPARHARNAEFGPIKNKTPNKKAIATTPTVGVKAKRRKPKKDKRKKKKEYNVILGIDKALRWRNKQSTKIRP